MEPRLEETVYLDFQTSSADGAKSDADSTPTAEVFENATDTTVVALTVTKRTSKTGNYRVAVPCTAANGFEAGKSYNVNATATVGGVTAGAVIGRFVVRPAAAVANVTQVNGSAVSPGVIDANVVSIAAGAIDSATFAAGTTIPRCTLVDTTTSNTDMITAAGVRTAVGLGSANLDTQLTTIDDFLDTEIAAIKLKTDNLPASPAAVGSAMTLADGAITEAKISTPAETAGRPTGILAMMRRVFEWGSNKRVRTRATGAVRLRNAADAADLETQTQSTAGGTGSEVDTQTKGA